MSEALDLNDDLVTVADGLSPVTLRRPGSAGTQNVAHALRRAVSQREAAASGGKYTQSDVVWHLPASELSEPPRLGDQIVEADGSRWTVLEVRRTTLQTRDACVTRNLAIAAGLDTFVTIQCSHLVTTASGARRDEWSDAHAGVAARIQLVREDIEVQHERRVTVQQFRITLSEQVVVGERCRAVDPQGAIYEITGMETPDRIDQLPVILAVRRK